MPKQAASGKTKVNAFIREFHNEFISTPTDELFCKLCEKVVKHDKRFHVDQHRNGSVHQAKLTIPTTSRQSFISTPNIPNFNETVVKTFLGANIPLKKLRHPAIRRLFIDMGHPLPSESTSRKIVENTAKEEENQMIYNFTNKDIFIVIDEAEVDGKKYLNILGGHVENPAHTVALESLILQSAPNQTTIVQHIDDCIRKLPIERKNFVLLLSDSASYMIAAGRALKLLYNNLFHVTCVAHLLNNCEEKIRNKYKNTDLLISSLKAATVKNPSRRNLYHEIGTTPQPVITRWGTWLDAAVNYFAEKLPQIREIIAQFPEDGQIVTKVKHAALSPELELELTEICRYYKSLLNLIGRIEGTIYSIMQAYRDLHALQFHEDPCSISEYISNRLLGKDFLDIINCTRENITPAMFSQLQQCCATSCAVERSFSLLKKLLSKETIFLPDNLKKYFIFYYNHAAKEIQ